MDNTKEIEMSQRHQAVPTNKASSESVCASCGKRVVSRVNVHGYAIWQHRTTGR